MTLTRQEISLLAHRRHPIACPLSDASVALLIEALGLDGGRLLDVGCGEGEWLARIGGRARASGVDLSAPALARAREKLGPGVDLIEAAAEDVLARGGGWDAVLCNGSCHALGGAEPAIARLGEALAPGGVLLFSDGVWQSRPTDAALAGLGAEEGDIPHIGRVFDALLAAGLAVERVHLSSQAEWDEYETAWCGALEQRAGEIEGDAPDDAALLRQTAREHRSGYRDGYRGVLGYLAVVARRPAMH
ncbi:class I SAM-dependent methyltransferase [Tsuneonella sp. HG222]